MRLARALLLLPFAVVACATPDDAASSDSNLDTSGCSGVDTAASRGPVDVSAARPPTASCWNIESSGLSLGYSWLQTNDSQPRKRDVGFWTSLNGADTFAKADSTACTPQASGGLGHDTSGTQTFRCTARKRIDFAHAPQLKAAAYGADGRRLGWDVQVAVALDDAGSWDSLDGANYRFSF